MSVVINKDLIKRIQQTIMPTREQIVYMNKIRFERMKIEYQKKIIATPTEKELEEFYQITKDLFQIQSLITTCKHKGTNGNYHFVKGKRYEIIGVDFRTE